MKKLVFFAIVIGFSIAATQAAHAKYNWGNTSYEKDAYGRWERSDTTMTDQDGDGVVNKYDRNNRNSNIW